MKTLKLAMCLLLAGALSACATSNSGSATGATTPSLTDTYMYLTERNAQARMATVYWLNPPKSADLERSAKIRAGKGDD